MYNSHNKYKSRKQKVKSDKVRWFFIIFPTLRIIGVVRTATHGTCILQAVMRHPTPKHFYALLFKLFMFSLKLQYKSSLMAHRPRRLEHSTPT